MALLSKYGTRKLAVGQVFTGCCATGGNVPGTVTDYVTDCRVTVPFPHRIVEAWVTFIHTVVTTPGTVKCWISGAPSLGGTIGSTDIEMSDQNDGLVVANANKLTVIPIKLNAVGRATKPAAMQYNVCTAGANANDKAYGACLTLIVEPIPRKAL